MITAKVKKPGTHVNLAFFGTSPPHNTEKIISQWKENVKKILLDNFVSSDVFYLLKYVYLPQAQTNFI